MLVHACHASCDKWLWNTGEVLGHLPISRKYSRGWWSSSRHVSLLYPCLVSNLHWLVKWAGHPTLSVDKLTQWTKHFGFTVQCGMNYLLRRFFIRPWRELLLLTLDLGPTRTSIQRSIWSPLPLLNALAAMHRKQKVTMMALSRSQSLQRFGTAPLCITSRSTWRNRSMVIAVKNAGIPQWSTARSAFHMRQKS